MAPGEPLYRCETELEILSHRISDLVTDIPTSDDGDQDDDVKLPQAMAASVFVSRALPA